MKADVVTLCHSALSERNKLSILGAFNIVYIPRIPWRLLPCTLVVRVLLDESDAGAHKLRITVMGTDGDRMFEDETGFELPPTPAPPNLSTSHQAASLNLICPLPYIVIKSYGTQVIDLALDGQEPQQTQFYVYPEGAEDVS